MPHIWTAKLTFRHWEALPCPRELAAALPRQCLGVVLGWCQLPEDKTMSGNFSAVKSSMPMLRNVLWSCFIYCSRWSLLSLGILFSQQVAEEWRSPESITSCRLLPEAHKMPSLPALAGRTVRSRSLSCEHLNAIPLWSEAQQLCFPLNFGAESKHHILVRKYSFSPFILFHEQTASFFTSTPVACIIPPCVYFMAINFGVLYRLPLLNLRLSCLNLRWSRRSSPPSVHSLFHPSYDPFVNKSVIHFG